MIFLNRHRVNDHRRKFRTLVLHTIHTPYMSLIFRLNAAAAFFGVFLAQSPAQNLQRLSLGEAVALTRENHPALRSFPVEEQLNTARLAEIRLRRGLKLQGNAEAQVNPFLPASIIPVGQFNLQNPTDETRAIRFGTWWQASIGLTARMDLIDASVKAQLREQEFQSSLTANDRAETETTAIAEATRAYYALLLADAETRMLESNLQRANVFLTDVEQRQSAGSALAADVNTARLHVSDAQLRLQQARQNSLQARRALLFRMGLPLEHSGTLNPGDSLVSLLNTVSATANEPFDLAAAEQRRPDLQRLVLDNGLQDLKIATEKSRLLPTLSASAYIGLNNLTDEVPLVAEASWFSNGNVALRLTVPLSEHWELKKHTGLLSLKKQKNAVELDHLRYQLRHSFETAYSAYELAKRQLPARQNDITLAAANLELARASYAGGNGLSSAVTDAETTLQQKQYAWLQTAYDLLRAALDMQLSRGELR